MARHTCGPIRCVEPTSFHIALKVMMSPSVIIITYDINFSLVKLVRAWTHAAALCKHVPILTRTNINQSDALLFHDEVQSHLNILHLLCVDSWLFAVSAKPLS